MAKGWYILHVYSGYEKKIERTIRALLENGDLSSDIVLDVKVPVEEVTDIKDGKKKTTKKLILPGYLMIELDLPDSGWKDVCSSIRRIQGVTGFTGLVNHNEKPRPISNDEAVRLLQKSGDIKGEKTVRMKQSYNVGEQVKIIDGPFASFTGSIEEVNMEKNKLRVTVAIFGRATPVEVDLLQVEKV
ncbi:MAG: transcription termination/antitermination protein NusG [Treponemataceae bacterium]|nr:transcription termination/antitermination protein NusG [Treponemataceae bacterium]